LTLFIALVVSQGPYPPIPGMNSGFGRGYDIVTQTNRAPVLKFTYTDPDNIYISPYDKQTYSYPDQCYITTIARGSVVEKINLFNTWEQYYSIKTSSLGVSVGLGIGAAEINLSFKQDKGKIEGYFKNKTRNIALDDRLLSLYQLELLPIMDIHISTPLKETIKNLPRTLNGNQEAYQRLIDGWGTHYVTASQFGGKLNITILFSSDLYNKYGSKWVSTQIGLAISYEKFKLNIDRNTFNNKSKVNETFNQNSLTITEHVGGQPQVFESGGYKEWVGTIPGNPVLLMDKTTLVPIHKLATDPVIRKKIRIALVNYVTYGHV